MECGGLFGGGVEAENGAVAVDVPDLRMDRIENQFEFFLAGGVVGDDLALELEFAVCRDGFGEIFVNDDEERFGI